MFFIMQRLYSNTKFLDNTETFMASVPGHVKGSNYRRETTEGGHISNPISAEPLDFVCACKMELVCHL